MTQPLNLKCDILVASLCLQKRKCNLYRYDEDMTRINTLIAKNTNMQEALATDNFVLETEIVGELKELEIAAVQLESKIEQSVVGLCTLTPPDP